MISIGPDNDIINVDDKPLIEKVSKHRIENAPKGLRSSLQTIKHSQKFIEAKMGCKGCLVHMVRID